MQAVLEEVLACVERHCSIGWAEEFRVTTAIHLNMMRVKPSERDPRRKTVNRPATHNRPAMPFRSAFLSRSSVYSTARNRSPCRPHGSAAIEQLLSALSC